MDLKKFENNIQRAANSNAASAAAAALDGYEDDDDVDDLDFDNSLKEKFMKRYNSLTTLLMRSFRKAKSKKKKEAMLIHEEAASATSNHYAMISSSGVGIGAGSPTFEPTSIREQQQIPTAVNYLNYRKPSNSNPHPSGINQAKRSQIATLPVTLQQLSANRGSLRLINATLKAERDRMMLHGVGHAGEKEREMSRSHLNLLSSDTMTTTPKQATINSSKKKMAPILSLQQLQMAKSTNVKNLKEESEEPSSNSNSNNNNKNNREMKKSSPQPVAEPPKNYRYSIKRIRKTITTKMRILNFRTVIVTTTRVRKIVRSHQMKMMIRLRTKPHCLCSSGPNSYRTNSSIWPPRSVSWSNSSKKRKTQEIENGANKK
jgi:hypothetical protein